MSKKRKSAKHFLRDEVEYYISKEYAQRRRNYAVGITGKPPDLHNPVHWGLSAWSLLKLRKTDIALKRAFKELGLNPKDPLDWKNLAHSLATALFYERKLAGAPKKWTREMYAELIQAFEQHQLANPDAGIDATCDYIAGAPDSPRCFRVSGGALKKALERARAEGMTPRSRPTSVTK